MTTKSHFKFTEHDYQFITDTWHGPKGAAYNVVYEDLLEEGLINRDGSPTSEGYARIQEFEMEKWDI